MTENHQTFSSPRIIRLTRPFHSKHRQHRQRKLQHARVVHISSQSSNSTHHSNIHSQISRNISKCSGNKIHPCDPIKSDRVFPSVNKTFSDRKDLADDYHRKRINNKKKTIPCFGSCSCLCITAYVFITLLLMMAITAILMAILHPSKKTTVKPITSSLRWNKSAKTIAGLVGQPGNGSNQFKYPWSLAIDPLYTLYIGDRQNNRIQKYLLFASTGTTIAGKASGQPGGNATDLYNPGYIHLDLNGDLYVPDTRNHRIQLWSQNAVIGVTVAGISGSAGNSSSQLSSPFGVTHDSNSGTLYVADSSNHRILSYPPGATSGVVVAGNNGQGTNSNQLSYPRNVYFDSISNSLIIANRFANNIVRWILGDIEWTLVAGNINGTSSSSSDSFQQPADMIFDVLGNMYVADDQNHRIQFFPFGQSKGITVAGETGIFGNDSEHLYYPSSMVVDNQLNLYVADQSNHRIQLFERY